VTTDFNWQIRRAAGRLPGERLEPAAEQPLGDIGIGRGASAQPSRSDVDVNERIRRQWKVITGRVDLDAIGNW
jgi:hypothetical protein